jgi:cation diffusion facilitator family transporter
MAGTVPAPDASLERSALRRSIAVTAVLGAIGVVWGVVSGSQMILLDGVYSFVGLLVSWLLIRASSMAESPPTRRYPYGRESVTPLVIGIQGFVLLATLAYAAFEAAYMIRAGGSEVTAGWAVAYGVVATVGAVATWRWLQQAAGSSDLLVAEATAWRIAALRGVGMVVGFTVLAVLQGSSWDDAAPYVDPVMVLITCVAFAPGPLRMVRSTALELLEAAPSGAIQAAVAEAVALVQDEFDLTEPEVRATKLGPKLYVEVTGVVDPSVTVAQQHAVREALDSRLSALPYDVWLNLDLVPRPVAAGD